MKTLVVGLGNPILGDDGVGWRIAEEIQHSGSLPPGVDVVCLAVGGIGLMEALEGYEKAIIIDAIVTQRDPIGTTSSFRLDQAADPSFSHLTSAHDTSLTNAIQVGRDLGIRLPDQITIVAIESQKVYDFSEELSTPVAAAIPEAVRLIMEILRESR